jgi:hypothetical protein
VRALEKLRVRALSATGVRDHDRGEDEGEGGDVVPAGRFAKPHDGKAREDDDRDRFWRTLSWAAVKLP